MKRIYLVRHGESEGNLDTTLYRHKADHAIELSDKGINQAINAGFKLRTELRSISHKNPIRLWSSPYTRTRQTANYIQKQLTWLPIEYRESILLVEQQFGLFDGLSDDEMLAQFPNEKRHYDKCVEHEGRFWARLPLGESRFDVCCRVHQFFGTLARDLKDNNIDTVIIVTHGVTIRAFIQGFLNLPYEWVDANGNPENCSIQKIEEKQVTLL